MRQIFSPTPISVFFSLLSLYLRYILNILSVYIFKIFTETWLKHNYVKNTRTYWGSD